MKDLKDIEGKFVTTHLELKGKTVTGQVTKCDGKTFDLKLTNGIVLKDVDVVQLNNIYG